MNKKGLLLSNKISLHLMLLLPVAILLIYSYAPMLGIIMAFQDYVPSAQGFLYSLFNSRFSGFSNFRLLSMMPDFYSILINTFFIAAMKIVSKLFFPLVFALLLNEVKTIWFKKTVQTISYMPFFLSWVILGGIFLELFSLRGIVNMILSSAVEPVHFFGNAVIFPYMIVVTDLWKDIGFNTIIFLSAITSIDPSIYESAIIDGAGRWKQILYVTVPSLFPIVTLVAILSLGNILNAGFEQIFILYSPLVYSSGDIIDTFVYRYGLQNAQFSLATAVGLFKSVVSMIMICLSYYIADKYSNYRVF